MDASQQMAAIAYVKQYGPGIYSLFSRVNKRITPDDFEDCVSEGIAIALELVSKGIAADSSEFYERFWSKLHQLALNRAVGSSHLSLDELLDQYPEAPAMRSSAAKVQEVQAQDIIARAEEETATDTTLASVTTFLTPTEGRVVNLILGQTDKGACSLAETASILGVTKATVQVLYNRAIAKIDGAFAFTNADGDYILSNPKAARSASVAGRRGGTRSVPVAPRPVAIATAADKDIAKLFPKVNGVLASSVSTASPTVSHTFVASTEVRAMSLLLGQTSKGGYLMQGTAAITAESRAKAMALYEAAALNLHTAFSPHAVAAIVSSPWEVSTTVPRGVDDCWLRSANQAAIVNGKNQLAYSDFNSPFGNISGPG